MAISDIAEQQGADAAIRIFRERYEFKYLCALTTVEANLRLLEERTWQMVAPTYALSDFKYPSSIDLWTQERLPYVRTLVLCGKSGMGKTELAYALLPEAFVCNNVESLRACTDFSGGIIFDEPLTSGWDPVFVVNLLERNQPRQLPARFHNIQIPGDARRGKVTRVIVCCNYSSWLCCANPNLQDAINRRHLFIDVTGPLF